MTTGGVTTIYHLPDPREDRPERLTFGPDGNIWFTFAYDVGKMKPDGTGFVRYPVAPYLGLRQRLGGIIAGPDGNLWFTESGGADWTHGNGGSAGGGIGRITLDGVITDWQTPTPGSGPIGIVAGPDGNVWFAEYAAYFHAPSKIGRITPKGAIQEFWVAGGPYGTGPWGMTVGHDSALWITESEGGKIARFDLASSPCPAPPPTAITDPARLPRSEGLPAALAPGSGSGVTRTGPPPPVPQPTQAPGTSAPVREGRGSESPSRHQTPAVRPHPGHPPPQDSPAREILDAFLKALLRFW
jgi:streptogramin lyase